MKKKIISILLAAGMLVPAIGSSAIAANIKEDVTESFVNEGFNGTFADTGFTAAGRWGTTNGYTTNNLAIESVDGDNALKIITMTDGDGTKVGFKYDIPTETLSSDYVMNISYRFNMPDTSGDFYAALYDNQAVLLEGSLQNYNQDHNVNIAFMSGGALKYGENYTYAQENEQSFADITAGEWYTVKSTVYVNGTSRVTALTKLLDKNNTVVGSHNRIVLSGSGVINPAAFTVMANKTVYFDDLKIDFTYDKKLSSYDIDVDFSEDGILKQFGRFDFWDPNAVGVTVENVDDNQVLRLKNYETRQISLAYYLPEALPDNFTMNVNYKMYMSNPREGWFQLYAAGDNVSYRVSGSPTKTQKGSISADDNTQSAVPVTVSSGKLGYYKAGTWYNDSFAELTEAESVWYDVSVSFDVKNGQRPTANVSIKNDDTVVASYKAQIGGVNCKTVKELQWWFLPTNTEQYVLIDDLSVEYSFKENTVSDTKFVYFNDEKGALTAEPEAAVKGAVFTLGEERNVTASLKSATDTVDVTVTKDAQTPSIVTLSWNKALKNEEYVLTVDYGAYEPFVYKFTAPAVEAFRVSSMAFYKGETKIENVSALNAGDEITLKVSFENETGATQNAVLLVAGYENDAMNGGVVYLPVEVETTDKSVEKTVNFTVKKDTDEIRGFVWDSVSSMIPMAGSVKL